MPRLVSLMVDKKEYFLPIADRIMPDLVLTAPEDGDGDKPGLFLELFDHPLSRLFVTLLWRINKEQEGDAIVLSNVWLREFAKLDAKSLRKYREYLHDHNLICCERLGSGREYLYRVVDGKGMPLDQDKTNAQALARLSDPEAKRQAVHARIAKKYRKSVSKVVASAGKDQDQPSDTDKMPSSWGNFAE